MKHELYISTKIDLDQLDEAIRLYSENVDGLKFNKFAFEIFEILSIRSHNLGEHEDFIKKIQKYIKQCNE